MFAQRSTKTVISVRDILRRQTQDIHERLHVHPMFAELTGGSLTHPDYRALLAALYGFHRPLERLILSVPRHWWFGLDPQPRLRAHRLAEDLAHLGFDWTHTPLLPMARHAPIDSPGRLMGCLYVREGATLGGRVLARALDPLLGNSEGGRHFFAGTLDNGRLWNETCKALEVAGEAGHLDDIVDGARATFQSFESWMDRAHARNTR